MYLLSWIGWGRHPFFAFLVFFPSLSNVSQYILFSFSPLVLLFSLFLTFYLFLMVFGVKDVRPFFFELWFVVALRLLFRLFSIASSFLSNILKMRDELLSRLLSSGEVVVFERVCSFLLDSDAAVSSSVSLTTFLCISVVVTLIVPFMMLFSFFS